MEPGRHSCSRPASSGFRDPMEDLSDRAKAALNLAREMAGFGADDLVGLPEGVVERPDGAPVMSFDAWRES